MHQRRQHPPGHILHRGGQRCHPASQRGRRPWCGLRCMRASARRVSQPACGAGRQGGLIGLSAVLKAIISACCREMGWAVATKEDMAPQVVRYRLSLDANVTS